MQVDEQEWERGKQEHVALSEAAAEIYDDEYQTSNFATAAYMNYEARELERLISEAPGSDIAFDLGCGTGRHSFILARHFRSVFGYDISPGMVAAAERAKMRRGTGNVRFDVVDVENKLPDVGQGKADLVSCSFGMGSFVRSLPTLFKTVRALLKPGGVAAFSWYNSEALVNRMQLPWSPALSARMVPDSNLLRVEFAGEVKQISAIPYHVGELRRELENNFTSVQITTYPTLTAMFPSELFDQDLAKDLCRAVDEQLRTETGTSAGGPYIFATARMRGRVLTDQNQIKGVERVEQSLRLLGVAPDRFEHRPLRNMADVRQQFPDVADEETVKAVVWAKCRRTNDGGFAEMDPRHDDLVLCLLPANRRVSQGKLARHFGVSTNAVYMLSVNDVDERTGFSVGAIPPFGMPDRVQALVDASLQNQLHVYTGSGRLTQSFKMSLNDLLSVSSASVADFSSESDK